MPLELRPTWCLDEAMVQSAVLFGEWMTADGRLALESDGDDWRPGQGLVLTREVTLLVDPFDLRRAFDLTANESVGVAARWSCRATGAAGVHVGGPAPIGLTTAPLLSLEVPADIASSIEVETCLVLTRSGEDRAADSAPDGALVWSDGWTIPMRDRTVLLEGGEARVPVRTISFADRFGQPSGALWAIDLDTSIDADDPLANVVTVLLNKDVLARDFRGRDGEPDAALLSPSALAGISVDLIRGLTVAMREELSGGEEWVELQDGSVGAMLVSRLVEAFGSIASALDNHERDEPTFSRELWNRFAPDSWNEVN